MYNLHFVFSSTFPWKTLKERICITHYKQWHNYYNKNLKQALTAIRKLEKELQCETECKIQKTNSDTGGSGPLSITVHQATSTTKAPQQILLFMKLEQHVIIKEHKLCQLQFMTQFLNSCHHNFQCKTSSTWHKFVKLGERMLFFRKLFATEHSPYSEPFQRNHGMNCILTYVKT